MSIWPHSTTFMLDTCHKSTLLLPIIAEKDLTHVFKSTNPTTEKAMSQNFIFFYFKLLQIISIDQ